MAKRKKIITKTSATNAVAGIAGAATSRLVSKGLVMLTKKMEKPLPFPGEAYSVGKILLGGFFVKNKKTAYRAFGLGMIADAGIELVNQVVGNPLPAVIAGPGSFIQYPSGGNMLNMRSTPGIYANRNINNQPYNNSNVAVSGAW